jgi:hypothetical protein
LIIPQTPALRCGKSWFLSQTGASVRLLGDFAPLGISAALAIPR